MGFVWSCNLFCLSPSLIFCSFFSFFFLAATSIVHASHKLELSALSRKLGVGAVSKLAVRHQQHASMGGSASGIGDARKDDNSEMKLALKVHKTIAKQSASNALTTMPSTVAPTFAPLFNKFPGKLTDEADCWSESPGSAFKVRGANYLQDGVKIKSRDCAFKLLHVEFFAVDEGVKVENIAGRSESFAGHVRRAAVEQGKEPPFLMVICFNFPGYAFACYFQRRVEVGSSKDPAFDGLFKKFVENGDDFRDERFKILPGIPPGGANFLVRKTVGNKVKRVVFFVFCVFFLWCVFYSVFFLICLSSFCLLSVFFLSSLCACCYCCAYL